MGSEKISLYVVLIVVAAVVWPIASHYNSVTIITTSQIIQKASATNATAGVTSSNLALGTPHLIGTEYLKTTSPKPSVVNGIHGLLVSFAGSFVLNNGLNATDTGKVFITNITGGADHSQGQGVFITKNGMATFIYLGIGPPGSSGDTGTIFYPKATGTLAYLENKIAIYKDETFKSGNAIVKQWEFK
jgi:hypothetical protein